VATSQVGTQTRLGSSQDPSYPGQSVSFTATLTAQTGKPTGSVTFLDGSTVLKVVPLDATGHATYTTSALAAGSHTITAAYSGGSAFQTSTAQVSQSVVAPTGDGPQVTLLGRFGINQAPTVLLLKFNSKLNAATAKDLHNYVLTAPDGHTIRILSAVYNAKAKSVTLRPAERLDVNQTYSLVVDGTSVTGVRGVAGTLLDGDRNGVAGSHYNAVVNLRNYLVGAPTVTPNTAPWHPVGPKVHHHAVKKS
jgi:hypothetical protein